MGISAAVVSFVDSCGVRHSAEVTAESLYEAAVLGLRAISEHWAEEPGGMTRIEIQAKGPTVTHEVTVKKLREWLFSSSRTPKEKAVKERLKTLMV